MIEWERDKGKYTLLVSNSSTDNFVEEWGTIRVKRNLQYEYYTAETLFNEKRTFLYLTDAKRWVEEETLGRCVTKKRKNATRTH